MNTKIKSSIRRRERRSISSKSLDSIFNEIIVDEKLNTTHNNKTNNSNLSCLQVFDIIGCLRN